jgi:hypothetical protein
VSGKHRMPPAGMNEEPWNDPAARKWLRHALEDMVPKMDSSTVVVSLVPKDDWDIKYAVELGAAIMMDKPIISVIHPGTPVSAKLMKVSDHIIEIDMDRGDSHEQLQAKLMPLVEKLLDLDEAEKAGEP